MFFCLMIRRPPRSTLDRSSAASDVYKRQGFLQGLAGGAAELDPVEGPGDGIEAGREHDQVERCLLYTSPSPRDRTRSRMPSSA